MYLKEEKVCGESVYDGTLLKVRRDVVVLPNGGQAVREFVQHPGACVVIPELRPGVYLFEHQFRYPLSKVFIEFPAGKKDGSEAILACAMRELAEETGYSASDWTHLGVMHNCIGYSDEQIDIFLARNLTKGQQKLDDGEFVELFEMTLADAESAIRNGLLTDAKTITCLYWLRLLEVAG